jgi:hypothetical protein
MNPDTLVLIIFIMALLIGPCLFVFLYSTTYVIVLLLQQFYPDDLPLVELGPETLIGCPDGLCYLHMSTKTYHSCIVNKIGHFPSILAISTISTSYRKKTAKRKFELISDNLAHFDPISLENLFGMYVVDKLMIPLHLIGIRNLVMVSSKPPQSYGCIENFHPLHQNQVLSILGSNPHLRDLLLVNPDYHLDTKGFLWDTGNNTCSIILYWVEENLKIWDEICSKAEIHPPDRITG